MIYTVILDYLFMSCVDKLNNIFFRGFVIGWVLMVLFRCSSWLWLGFV
jgi:hypothetical protein